MAIMQKKKDQNFEFVYHISVMMLQWAYPHVESNLNDKILINHNRENTELPSYFV